MDSNTPLIISAPISELLGICENNYGLEDRITKVDWAELIFPLSHNPCFLRATADGWIDEYANVGYRHVRKEGNRSGVNSTNATNPSNPTEDADAFPVENAYNAYGIDSMILHAISSR